LSQRGKRLIAWACIIGMMVLTLSGSIILLLQNTQAPAQQEAVQPEIFFIDGEIQSIDKNEKPWTLTIGNDDKTVDILLLDETFVGDATKSPEKTDDFLEVGMKGTFTYADIQGRMLAVSINIVE